MMAYSVAVWAMCTLCLIVLASTVCSMPADECDWTGSGLTHGDGVVPVYLRRCSSGRLVWLYPGGALRLVLRHPHVSDSSTHPNKSTESWTNNHHQSSGGRHFRSHENDTRNSLVKEETSHKSKEFRACVLVHNTKSLVQNDHNEYHMLDKPSEKEKRLNFPARLFLEGTRSLVPLYAADDGGASVVRCFRSRGGRAAIYVEADDIHRHSGDHNRPKVVIDYDLQLLDSEPSDSWEACRPCTAQEMVRAYCTSDTVVRGRIFGVQHVEALDSSQLTVRVTKRLRGTKSSRHQKNHQQYNHEDNAVHADDLWRRTSNNVVTMQAPSRCELVPGADELVLMGRMRLGRLALVCSPRLHQWASVVQDARERGDAPCVLDA